MNRTTVERHLASLEGAFDEAAGVVRTPYAFASDISAAARPISIDGSRDLIDQGYHREAVFWLVATYGRCLHILHQDGTPEQYARHQLGLEGLLADLGIHEPDELERRSGRVLARAPGIWDTAEAILAINADARS
jgi:hypothetical protein